MITGEGQYDATSLSGKVVGAVLAAAAAAGVRRRPSWRAGWRQRRRPGVRAVELTELAGSAEAARAEPARWLTAAARLLAAGRGPIS